MRGLRAKTIECSAIDPLFPPALPLGRGLRPRLAMGRRRLLPGERKRRMLHEQRRGTFAGGHRLRPMHRPAAGDQTQMALAMRRINMMNFRVRSYGDETRCIQHQIQPLRTLCAQPVKLCIQKTSLTGIQVTGAQDLKLRRAIRIDATFNHWSHPETPRLRPRAAQICDGNHPGNDSILRRPICGFPAEIGIFRGLSDVVGCS